MTQQQGIALARDFVRREFVDRGMVADLNVHWDVGADGSPKPHAHVMLSMRAVDEKGFGKKVREWNRTDLLKDWREHWADHVNERLASLDIEARVDHRSFEAQGIDLEPQHKIGAAGARRLERGEDCERAEDHLRIARENGEKIIADPRIALDAITRNQATFTGRELAMFVHRHSDGKGQFDQAVGAVRSSPEIYSLGRDGCGEERFTSREMIRIEVRLERASDMLARSVGHAVSQDRQEVALGSAERNGLALSGGQRAAFEHVTGKEGLACVIGYAGSGKSAMLSVAREAWEGEGFSVRGAALSGIAAENLEGGSGIQSRTLASLERQWEQGRELLTSRDVLVIDEAGMIGSRQLARILTAARKAEAKVVLVGDPEQLQAIEAGAAFRSVAERHGAAEITEIRRQREDWQRDATRQLATGRSGEAIDAYADRGMVHAAETRELARNELVASWDRQRQVEPDKSRIILTHTNAEVRDLNDLARERLRSAGELGEDVTLTVERGKRTFAPGDRVMFLRNERGLAVKNGTLGSVEQVSPERMAVRLDDGRHVAFDLKDYNQFDHGYAATFHKAQGVTVDRAHVLATPGMDRHAAYVGLSRHRDGVELHYGRDDFQGQNQLVRALSRDRAKDMASDYVDAFAERRGIEPRSMEERWKDFVEKVKRHARAVSAIFKRRDDQLPPLPENGDALQRTRRDLDRDDPNAARDLERAYKADPPLAHEAASGRTQRAIRAMQLVGEMRENPNLRADHFVAEWNKLEAEGERAYQEAGRSGLRAVHDQMRNLAKSLERDPQLESLVAQRTQQLGIGADMQQGRGIARELAFSRGIDWDIGRGLGL
jgi:Ti-type conjugative transfer relaxase TraA